jgi:hypothetical protein
VALGTVLADDRPQGERDDAGDERDRGDRA